MGKGTASGMSVRRHWAAPRLLQVKGRHAGLPQVTSQCGKSPSSMQNINPPLPLGWNCQRLNGSTLG